MIVARFTSATGWDGKTITYDNGDFALEDHGLVAVQDVLRYDQLGQLTWEYDGLREWAVQLAAGDVGYAPEPYAPASYSPANYAPASYAPAGYAPPTVVPASYAPATVAPGQPVAQYPTGGYAAPTYSYQATVQPSPPGIAIAGFILALAGFIFPILWLVGLGLSWAGHQKAVREDLPTGLALAGLIINAVMTLLSLALAVFIIILAAAS